MAIEREAYFKVRDTVGLFDATKSYGRLFARGKDAIDLLHRLSTNDLKPLEQAKNKSALTFLTNEKGRIVDLLEIVRDGAGETVLITSAGREEAVIQWLDKFTIMEDARFEPATEKLAQFELIGPKASEIVGTVAPGAVLETEFGKPAIIIVRKNGWITLLTPQKNSSLVWDTLRDKVQLLGGNLVDSELYEVFRIEHGIPLAPNELNEKHNPLETPLAAEAVSFTKGCYIGQEVIARLDAQHKVQRQLVGLLFAEAMPVIGSRIIDLELPENAPLGNEIGVATSMAKSPEFGAIGLGYVRGKYANPGTQLSVKDGAGNIFPVTLVTLPFDDGNLGT